MNEDQILNLFGKNTVYLLSEVKTEVRILIESMWPVGLGK